MAIYVNGDSWTWNHDLHSKDIWANILAGKLNTTCINESAGCGSNSRIVDCLRNQLVFELKPELVIIVLTSHYRYHVPAPNFGAWSVGACVAINDRTGAKNDQIRNWIYGHSYEEIDSVYRYYRDIWTMDLLCKQFGCPYLFVQGWDDFTENLGLLKSSENISQYVAGQCSQQSCFSNDYARSFEKFRACSAQWSYVETPLKKILDRNTDFDDTGHPNPIGHQKIADKIYQYLQERKII